MKKFFSYTVLVVASAFLVAIFTGCEKFPDPGLDQETYRPDSTNQYSANKRRVLLISVDGLSSEALQAINPPAINSLLNNSKYFWDLKPSVVTAENLEKDITSFGTLSLRLENGSGAAANEGSRKLVDSNFNNMHSSGPITAILPDLWFRLQFPQSPVVGAYSLTSGTGTVTVRDPKNWTFEGSDDGSNWTILDRQTEQVFSARSQTKKYSFVNWKGFQFYRLVVSEIYNISATGYFQMAEWRVIQTTFMPGINAASWGSMMTGNSRTIHRIGDSSFYASPVDTTNTVPVSPNLTALRLLHDYDYGIKSVAISSWSNLVTTLLKDADQKFVTASDEETKNKAVDLLKKDSSYVFVTQFGDVFNTRAQYGTSNSSQQFIDVVNKTDGYIKELTDAVKSRASYGKEEWLILITSTQGGTGMGLPVDLSRSFLIAYNPLFKQQDLSKMNPVINVQQEDVARQILYWMKVPGGPAIQTGQLWLDRFGVEFIK